IPVATDHRGWQAVPKLTGKPKNTRETAASRVTETSLRTILGQTAMFPQVAPRMVTMSTHLYIVSTVVLDRCGGRSKIRLLLPPARVVSRLKLSDKPPRRHMCWFVRLKSGGAVGVDDTSIEDLRARVQKVAEQVSRQLAKTPAGEQFFFVNDLVTAVENAVGDVVNVAQDAVNTVVNATHDAVTAIEFVGERIVHALDNLVDDATVQTDFIVVATHTLINDVMTEPIALVGGPQSDAQRPCMKPFSRIEAS